jgi:hypothetical protein
MDCGFAINPSWLPVLNQPSHRPHSPHYKTPVTSTAVIILTFVTAEEDLQIKTSCPFNEVAAVYLLNNP